jgi:hypothetical protein
MKLLIKCFICLFAGISIYSCDYLDVVPDNVATLDHAFADRYQAEKFLSTCYWGLPRMGSWNTNPAWLGAMEMILNREYQSAAGMRIALGQDNVAPIMNYWGSMADAGTRSLYAGIRDCNTFLENIERVQDLDRYEIDRQIAEVKLLKAYMHFYLLRYYGPVCPLRESAPVSESTRGVQVYREKIDDCFAYILQLIDEVIDSHALPSSISATPTELGRFVEAAAYAIKAKVLVYRASPFFNGNTNYNDFLDRNGEPFFNQVYDAGRWTAAAEACKEAIAVCEDPVANIRLYQREDYIKTQPLSDSTWLVNALRDSYSGSWTVEQIWTNSASYIGTEIRYACLPRLQESTADVTGILSVPLSTVDLFYSERGIPIEEDPLYDVAGMFNIRTGDDDHKYYIQTGEATAAMNFDREPRFYSTLGFNRGKWYGNSFDNTPVDDSQAMYPKNLWNECSSVSSSPSNYNATGYWPKKLLSLSTQFITVNTLWYQPYGYPELRFADLLLMCAEALNESKNAPDAEVYEYIDRVRARAGLEGVVESWRKYSSMPDKPASKAGMREIIRRERKIELACEGHYYWDIRRWNIAHTELNNRLIQGWTVTSPDVSVYYTVNTVYTQKFNAPRDYLAPIPETDLIKNPSLVQNPGW